MRKINLLSILCVLFLVSSISVFAACEEKDYGCQIRELQNENKKLQQENAQLGKMSALFEECDVNDLECRISSLEAQNAAQQQDLNDIYDNLNFIYEVLDFMLCDAMQLCGEQIACYDNEDCGGMVEESFPFCDEAGKVVKEISSDVCIEPGSVESFCDVYTETELLEECLYGCEEGACLPPPEEESVVVFRTNVVEGDYYESLNGAWIAIDRDGDDSLEGYGMRARSSWAGSRCDIQNSCDGSTYPCIMEFTPTADKVIDYNNLDMIVVCDVLNHKQVYFKLGDSDANNAQLSSEPTEPYASNNQESYGGGVAPGQIWTTMPPFPLPMANMLAETINGKIYAGAGGSGGASNGRFFSFDFNTNSWTEMVRDSDIYERASGVFNGKLYALGGVTHGGPLSVSSAYDPTTNSWSSVSSMPTPRVAHKNAGTLVNGKIYVMGGSDVFGQNDGTNATEAYNPTTNTWETKAQMPRNRIHHATAAVGNKIYVFGGQNSSFDVSVRTTFDVIDVYDTATNTWSTLGTKVPKKLYGHDTVSFNGKIYIFGGFDDGIGKQMSSDVYEFDPISQSFTKKTPMPQSLGVYFGTAVHNGIIYLVGGENLGGNLNGFLAYNPALDD